MHETAQDIFDYLPISKSKPESDYIEHLWGACVCLDSEENDLNDYVNIRLLNSGLCPADFRFGMLSLFDLEGNAGIEEWQSAVLRVIDLQSESGIFWLKHISQNHSDKNRRLIVNQILSKLQKVSVLSI